MSKPQKKALVPALRFPEFQNSGEWKEKKLGEFISTISPPKKLLTTDYLAEGQFPVIDQSQSYICGWTNDDEAIITDGFPLIVFGDHTCILKLVDQPFAQGADGIKIFKPNKSIQTEFLYQSLQFKPLVMEQYKRHFSIFKEREVAYPDSKSGEQQKIADCLSSIDDLITAQTQKLAALKEHKKGLMQQLFPAEGETVPKLRFPEFRDGGEWKSYHLEEVASFLKGKGISKADIAIDGKLPCIRYGELYTFYGEVIGEVNSRTNLPPKNLVLSKANDVIIPASGETQEDIATASCVKKDGIALGGDLNIIRTKNNGVFLAYYLNSAKKKDIAQMAQGISVVHLYANQLKALNVQLPEIREQRKIADCLSSVDELITAQSQKIEVLKSHKKGLMQQLFPSMDEVDG